MRIADGLRILGVGLAVATLAAACSSDRGPGGAYERTAQTSQAITILPAINNSPAINTFVLYAERSVQLGVGDHSLGGDIGVAALAVSSFGTQLTVGNFDGLDPLRNLYAPSVSLGELAVVGDVETNALQNNGGSFNTKGPFPASAMPTLPMAIGATPGTTNISVAPLQIETLNPGNYGTLTDDGILFLNPGAYSFASVTLGALAQLQANPGGATTISIAGNLAVGQGAHVFPLLQTADALAITVAGNDGANRSPPAASIGRSSQITALITAPHGTLLLGDNVQALGAFAAFDIALGNGDFVTFQTGFSTAVAYPHGTQMIAGEVPASIAAGTVPLVGPVPGSATISLTLGLPLSNQDNLTTLIEQLYDPRTAQFHKYLTPTQFADAFGATQADYDAIASFVQSNGLQVASRYDARYLLTVTGSASIVESTFFVALNLYQRPDSTVFYAPANNPSVNLSVPILHISDLDSFAVPQAAGGTGPTGCTLDPTKGTYLGNDLRAAYVPQSCTTNKGEQQSVALVEFDSYLKSDIDTYASAANITEPTLDNVQVPRSAPTFSPGNGSAEVVSDIDMLMTMVPAATVYVYEKCVGTTCANPTQSNGLTSLDAVPLLGQIASEDLAPVISSSWVWSDNLSDGNVASIFQQYAVQGQSFFQASGDDGSYASPTNTSSNVGGCNFPQVFTPTVGNPIIDSSLMTVVGGTILSTATVNADGGYPTSYYQKETTWKDLTVNTSSNPPGAATGGGFANAVPYCSGGLFLPELPIPTYQVNINPSNAEIVGSTTLPGNVSQARMIPDVSIVGAELTTYLNGFGLCNWGTSLSAPLWAGIAVLINQNSPSGPIGFANPSLYAKAQAGSSSYTANFNDINDDSNNNLNGTSPFEYHAVPGYDLATGLGSPTCNILTALPPQSCMPGTSLSLLVDSTNNVTAYVPNGSWGEDVSGVLIVPIEGSVAPQVLATPAAVNTCSGNSVTGRVVCTANQQDTNGNDVYLVTAATSTTPATYVGLTSDADQSALEHFSGGSCSSCNVAVDPVHNVAYLSIATDAGAAIQPVNLPFPLPEGGATAPAFLPPIPLGQSASSEDILVDPIRGPLVLSPNEFGDAGPPGDYQLVSATTGAVFNWVPPGGAGGNFDQAAEDCTTGIALASSEFPDGGQIFLADLTRATFDGGAWQALPGAFQFQSVPEFGFGMPPLAEPAAGPIAVAPNTHLGVVASEFGGTQFGAFSLPLTAGADAGVPALQDWVVASMPNTPDVPTPLPWANGADPHNLTAYRSPNPPYHAYAVIEDDAYQNGTRTWLAVVDLEALLGAARLPAPSGQQHTVDPTALTTCTGTADGGTCVVRFVMVP